MDGSEVRSAWIKCREYLSQCGSDKLSQARPAGSQQEPTLHLTPDSRPPSAHEPQGDHGQVSWSEEPAPCSLVWSCTLTLPVAPFRAAPTPPPVSSDRLPGHIGHKAASPAPIPSGSLLGLRK